MEKPSRDSIAVIGAGPAGARCAELLAAAGREVLLFDGRAPWEKPCGGMLSPDVLRDFPFLAGETPPRFLLREAFALSPRGQRASLFDGNPVSVIDRSSLNAFQLEKAVSCGVRFVPERVKSISHNTTGWTILTAGSSIESSIIIGCDGVKSTVRLAVLGPLPRKHRCVTCGYFVSGLPEGSCSFSFTDIQGYLWIFSRPQYGSAGIGARQGTVTVKDLYARLDAFLAAHYPKAVKLKKWSALLPSASSPDFFDRPACGENWLLAGDAAGHVDPVTGEGIYYALKDGELAARAVLSGDVPGYDALWREAYGNELKEKAAYVQNLVSLSRSLGPETYGAFLYRYFIGG